MRRFLAFALKAGISALLLYFAIAGVNLGVLGARLKELKIEWMLCAVALAGIQTAFLAARWQQIARACAASMTAKCSFRLSLISAFFNQVLPSTVGGDAMRIWLFSREGAGWAKATHSVLLDRFIGLLALALLVVACLPWTLEFIKDPVGRTALLVIGVGSIFGALAFVASGYLRWRWLQAWTPSRHLTEMARTVRRVLFVAKTGVAVMSMSFAIHGLTAAIAWCAARSIDAPMTYVDALQLIPPVMLISTIPISVAGWGVREKSLVLAFAYAGLPETDGFLVSVLLGLAMFAIGAIGGAVWLTRTDQTKPGIADYEKQGPA